ncbi:arabinan endo-1,5-alpha-L-arabinosidase [Kutzneria kofuensis]|uniref:Arabinan endo-1,5-alpha-L-arabinosidase n=1 Tax=Kutzneria kofuensis TaxID=103725 RepID=A0A7W9KES8_9PSEU|nr:arabinan endo-1,5-alpha-L-arabinosidase [Kutzneria kofuensis]MBB5891100.1 arabinan endo-1,5-alpha-L-arabinosidase [Kutzneria kofuensis]
MAALLVSPGVAPAYPNPGTVSGATWVHDPAMIRISGGDYAVFSTGAGLPMTTSTDRKTYSAAGAALPNGVSWASRYTGGSATALWAPDISYHNGKYLLYFAASSFGSNTSAIGLATSTSGRPGTFVDQGTVYTSSSGSDYNAIDPSLTVDAAGKWWLVFGSWWSGIKMIQIDPSTGKQLSSNTTRYSLAGASGGIEGATIFHHGDYYYLFTSRGLCCKGVNSTYWIAAGRSSSITGPYRDQAGTALTNGGGTKILATHGNFVGPGGESVYSDTDHDLLVYHYYDATANGAAKLGINYLNFSSDGWPYVS